MCMICDATSAAMAKDDFAGSVMAMMNGAASALLLSVGHRTGLFDAMADGVRVTADELAAKAGLHPRYVAEWLDGLTTSRVIIRDGEDRHFHLPAPHAYWLTRTAPEANLAAGAQFVSVLGGWKTAIV